MKKSYVYAGLLAAALLLVLLFVFKNNWKKNNAETAALKPSAPQNTVSGAAYPTANNSLSGTAAKKTSGLGTAASLKNASKEEQNNALDAILKRVQESEGEINSEELDQILELSFNFLEPGQIQTLEAIKDSLKKFPERSFPKLREYYEELPRARFDFRHATLDYVGHLGSPASTEFLEKTYQDNLDYLRSDDFGQLDSRAQTKAYTLPLASARALIKSQSGSSSAHSAAQGQASWQESFYKKIEEKPPAPIKRFLIIQLLYKNEQAAEYKEKLSKILPAQEKYMLEGL